MDDARRRAFATSEGRRLHPEASQIFSTLYMGDYYVHVFLPGEDGARTYLVDEYDMPDDQQAGKEQYIVNVARLVDGVSQAGTKVKVFDEPVKILTIKRYRELLRKAGEDGDSGEPAAGD